MQNLTPEGLRIVAEIAGRHGVSLEATFALLDSLALGNGSQAQFNHPDLGGMGQWSQGGMVMVGDMFNQGLKHRVDGLCNELSNLLRSRASLPADAARAASQSQSAGGVSLFKQGSGSTAPWWPAELGAPASSGAQNGLRYAFFPASRRLAIQQGGDVRVYDTGEHRLSGFSQQQGGDASLTFVSQLGTVGIAELPLVSPEDATPPAPASATAASSAASSAPPPAGRAAPPRAANEILAIIEGLAGLRQKNVLTEEEFAAKKAELLGRL